MGLVRVAERCPGMLDQLRRDLACGLPKPESEIVKRAGSSWHRSDVLAALLTLSRSGALVANRLGSTTTYASTSELSRTIDQAVATAALLPDLRRQFDQESHAALVVSWPSGLPDLDFRRWRSSRLVLVDMIDSANASIILLFPFVDMEGVEEICRAIERALLREVRVTLRTRYLSNRQSANARLAERLSRAPKGDQFFEAGAMSLSDASRELLHAKALVVDDGRRAYVGSANLTLGGLGDSIEIGLALEGASAASVAALVREVVSAGSAK